MGLLSSDRARRDGRVTVVQLLSALAMFVAFSVMGGFLVAGLALPVVTVAGSAATGSAELFDDLPTELQDVRLNQQSNIYASDGTLLATFYDQNRVVVPLEEMSPWIQKAQVAIEDKRFWLHNGVDGEGLMRAVYVNLTSESSPGASTLTQQLVKNTLLEDAVAEGDDVKIAEATEVSLARKIREWRLALNLEEDLTNRIGNDCTEAPEVDCAKEQILEQYLNIAQYGPSVYGVETAASFYFNKSAKDLTAIEAATIAGITQNPSKWDPVRHPKDAEQRRDTVLLVMKEQDMITERQFTEYVNTPLEETLNLNYPKFSCRASADAPFFCDYVTKVIANDPIFKGDGKSLLYTGGLEITTTLDLRMQKIANAELRESLPEDDPSGWAMALVSLDTETGAIKAMAQNREFDPANKAPNSTAINYSTDRDYGGSRGFSPGSTFKPIVLAAWLDSGRSLNQVVSGSIREWKAEDWTAECLGSDPYRGSGPWKPGNTGNTSASAQSVLSATANSVNTAYVAMANQLDLCDIETMGEKLGFKRADGAEVEVVPSMTLGTQNASPLTMASVMQTFANGGVHCEPYAIVSITKPNGDPVAVPPQTCERAISEELADGVAYAMTQVMERGSGEGAQLADGRPSAGKTGTSQNNAHTWFAGYTPQLTSVVWLGNPDQDIPGQFIKLNGETYDYLYGSTFAAPTWKRFMDQALEGQEILDLPTTASDDILYGIELPIPDVVGDDEFVGKRTMNDAGFQFTKSGEIYSEEYEVGQIVSQSISGGSKARAGTTITYVLATDKRPDWWTNWPANWDPNVAPEDYWGTAWPPAEFATSPPAGWNPLTWGQPDPNQPDPNNPDPNNPDGGDGGDGNGNGGPGNGDGGPGDAPSANGQG